MWHHGSVSQPPHPPSGHWPSQPCPPQNRWGQAKTPKWTLPASPLQRTAVWFAWLGLLVPVLFVVIRFGTGVAGWITVSYMFFGLVAFGLPQIVLAILVTVRAEKVRPAAGGPVSSILMLVSYAAHLLAALVLYDFGDTGPAAPSWLEQVFGVPETVASVLGVALLLAWATSHLTAIVFAAIEGSDSALVRAAGQATRR